MKSGLSLLLPLACALLASGCGADDPAGDPADRDDRRTFTPEDRNAAAHEICALWRTRTRERGPDQALAETFGLESTFVGTVAAIGADQSPGTAHGVNGAFPVVTLHTKYGDVLTFYDIAGVSRQWAVGQEVSFTALVSDLAPIYDRDDRKLSGHDLISCQIGLDQYFWNVTPGECPSFTKGRLTRRLCAPAPADIGAASQITEAAAADSAPDAARSAPVYGFARPEPRKSAAPATPARNRPAAVHPNAGSTGSVAPATAPRAPVRTPEATPAAGSDEVSVGVPRESVIRNLNARAAAMRAEKATPVAAEPQEAAPKAEPAENTDAVPEAGPAAASR